jgi:hypothetical protein
MKLFIFSLLLLSSAYAEVDEKVFIRGKVSNSFDEKQVKISDNLGQTYYLPRTAFPGNFEFKQGKEFNLEIDEKDIKNSRSISMKR